MQNGSWRGRWVAVFSAILMPRGTAVFPQVFAEKSEKTDLTGYQFWHRICV